MIREFLHRFFERRAVRVVGVVAFLVIVVVLLFLVLNWYVAPTKPSERKDLILAVAQILGGTALLSGLYFTWRTLQVNREGQITERFTRAIDQLGKVDDEGNKVFEIRIGGIYALERIARESEEDYWPITDVLCAYVRKHAPRKKRSAEETSSEESKRAQIDSLDTSTSGHERAQEEKGIWFWGSREHEPADPDIQAILTVLRQRSRNIPSRPYTYFGDLPVGTIRALDLHETNLTNTNLRQANLRSANFFGADLTGDKLSGSNLEGAQLSRSNLRGATLSKAQLGALSLFVEADLTGAKLTGANLSEAILWRAKLTGADLAGANLSDAENLAQWQLEETLGDETTLLPPHLKPPAHWGVKPDEQPEADEQPEED